MKPTYSYINATEQIKKLTKNYMFSMSQAEYSNRKIRIDQEIIRTDQE